MKGIWIKTAAAWCVLTVFSTPHAAAAEYVVDKQASKVTFLAVGKPGFLKIRGEGGTVEGALQVDGGNVAGELTAGLASLKTGIDLRDEHMHEKYLETAKFPTATLKLTAVTVPNGAKGSCAFEGVLTIKGVAKPVKGTCEADGVGADTLKVTAKAEVKMADFPIGVPSHLGVTVAEKVEIAADITAKAGVKSAQK